MLRHYLIFLFVLSQSVGYAGFVIHKGETVTTTQVLVANGDEGLIEQGGTLAVAGGDGVDMNGPNEKLFNYGTILAGTIGVNVNAAGTNAFVQNFGLLTANGLAGIQSDAASSILQNYGTILAPAANGIGILVNGSNSVADNFGTITAFISGLVGTNNNIVLQNFGLLNGQNQGGGIVSNNNENVTMQNAGTIIATNGNGINSLASFSLIQNYGLIDSPTMIGIFNGGGESTNVENYGTLFGQMIGIFMNPDNSSLINAGTLISPTLAIQFNGFNQTLVLLQGSNIQGIVTTNVAPLNLTVGSGLNLLLTLSSGTFGALDIHNPFVLVGDTIAVLDPTELAMQADIAADLSDTIFNGLYRHRPAFPCSCLCKWSSDLWVEGIGSYRKRREHELTPYFYQQGGFLAGYDLGTPDGHFSLFGGGLAGEGKLEPRTQKAFTRTGFGGVYYEKQCRSHFFAAACAGGFTELRNRRQIAYNLTPGGLENADSKLYAPFVTPEVTYAHYLPDCWFFPDIWLSPLICGTLRYVAFFAHDYTEKGSSANLWVKGRTLQLLTARGVIGFPFCFSCKKIEPYFGGGGRFQFGGNEVEATLLNTKIHFDTGAPRNLGYVIAGLSLNGPFGPFLISFNGELNADNFHSYRFLVEGSLGLYF